MHFISIKSVLSNHLSYVTIFHCSIGRSHKTGLTVYAISSTNKTDRNDITGLLLKMVLTTITPGIYNVNRCYVNSLRLCDLYGIEHNSWIYSTNHCELVLHAEVYSIQLYAIKVVCDLWQSWVFSGHSGLHSQKNWPSR